MGKVYKQLENSKYPELDHQLHDKCISRNEVMKELNVTRSYYYSNLEVSDYSDFINKHANDWTFTPEKLEESIAKSGLGKTELAELLDIHFVHIYSFLSGKQRPTRTKQHYQKIEKFCKEWFCF